MKYTCRLCLSIFVAALVLFSSINSKAMAEGDSSLLAKGDIVSVWVVGEPDLSVDASIGKDGRILMPLIGYVEIAGMSKDEATKVIEDAYRDGYLQKPIVHISLRVHSVKIPDKTAAGSVHEVTKSEDDNKSEGAEDKVSFEEDYTEETDSDASSGNYGFVELTVEDSLRGKGLRRAVAKFPNGKSRYTDRRGYVKLPFRMADKKKKVTVLVSCRGYEQTNIDLDFSKDTMAVVRLPKKGSVKPLSEKAKADLNKTLESASKVINDSPVNILESRISMEFSKADLHTILRALAGKFNLKVNLADSDSVYSLKADNVTVRDFLKNLLLSNDCQYSLNDRVLTVFTPTGSERKTAKEILFRDMSLLEALRILAGMMKINLFISDKIKDRTVNFYIDSLNLNDLFEILLETNGLKKVRKGVNSYLVEPEDK